ncbi:PWWP domain-containing protein 2B isoform X1 [Sapajus apella]|uniref:PWWP domain-containing protein 2B isoform X1 n=2 Tax=Sapajus apella TaxID=9515 RepID=A0A6J3I5V9_SAPAP|nr:PWWP domain-containing protein 2B isoform X1 [Sapajus apella]XP_032137941.1 PWWP domain-containing protein 2B isoform X1 [Sapajus apella]
MEPRAGCRLPVRVEQVVNGALVVTVSCGERSFAGILLDCTKKSGLFGLPPSAPLPQADDTPASSSRGQAPEEGEAEVMQLGPDSPPPPQGVQSPETAGPEPPPPLIPPLPAGSLPPYPPYFEGAPFPHPLWLRNTYKQWVPQPPPRTIKRTRRRLSRNRDPGRLILSTIRLRPRQVLCEKCKSTLSPPEASPGPPSAPRARRRLGSGPDRELHKPEEPESSDPVAAATTRRSKRERREEDRAPAEQVPRSPVIKISYSTPQGKGEVVKIPSRVHGSLEPFCPQQAPEDEGSQDPEVPDREPRDRPPGVPSASIPKLKLTRPVLPSTDLPPPKIRLKPHRLGDSEHEPVYRAELVEELNGCPRASSPMPCADGPATGLADLSSGSSGEDDDLKSCPQGPQGRGGLAFLVSCPEGRADCASELACSSDSLDEARSSGSEGTPADAGDLSPSHGASAPSSSREVRPTVPPLTVRLHTQSVSECITEDGRTVAVGDIVWGKIHGFPWWPARVLGISLGQKEDGEPSWREAKVSWFGSPTTSFLSISKLSPFSEFFKLRFNRKKKGMYRKAITEAANAARHVAPEIRELLTQFET